jgi:hypothetical protein
VGCGGEVVCVCVCVCVCACGWVGWWLGEGAQYRFSFPLGRTMATK